MSETESYCSLPFELKRCDPAVAPSLTFFLDRAPSTLQFQSAAPNPAGFSIVRPSLKQVIEIMCDSAKESLKKMGMHLPPWRKYRYMHTKWFGPYKRTTNAVAAFSPDESSLARELGSIALKGAGWDRRFKHQMELILHFEKGNSRLKLKPNSADEIVVVGTDWTPPELAPRPASQAKVSGLACALNEAGLTSSLGSQKGPQKQQQA